MAWPPWRIITTLSEADKQARRHVLDRYALYAQLSALVPVAALLLFRLVRWWATRSSRAGGYDAVPSSPVLKERRNSGGVFAAAAWGARGRRRVGWWLGEDVKAMGMLLGQRDRRFALWVPRGEARLTGEQNGLLVFRGRLGFCCFVCWRPAKVSLSPSCTSRINSNLTLADYMHLTKRFGSIAISQWPMQYLLALKSLNPVAYLLGSSHEQVNRWHRVLARITTTLLCLHAAFYLNFFIRVGRLDLLGRPVVVAGIMAFLGLNLLVTTALRPVRRYSYRLFFMIHVVAGVVIPLQLLFHAAPARVYLLECLGVFVLDLVSRKIDTVTGQATVESIPGTNLVRISASIPHTKVNRFRAQPGSHIYLSLPAAARKSMSAASASHLLFEFLFNPFTVASVDERSGDLTLVARHCGGPMTAALGRLAAAARSTAANRADEEKIPLFIEGPYGAASRLSRLCSDFDRILLVAGGVGATFTVPLYRAITSENPGAKVEMVWAIRGAGDATWAVTGADAQSLLKDDNIHIFITGAVVDPEGPDHLRKKTATQRRAESSGGGDGEVEMSAMYRDRRRGRYTSQHNRKRPDLKEIVDDLFKHGQEERVAVLVCGPNEMARELREHVGFWVRKGRTVWFHKEGFGF